MMPNMTPARRHNIDALPSMMSGAGRAGACHCLIMFSKWYCCIKQAQDIIVQLKQRKDCIVSARYSDTTVQGKLRK